MPGLAALASALHALSAVVWVGGMFFAYMVLRPAAGPLEGPDRLRLWSRVFPRFFAWVWAAVVLLPLTGFGRTSLQAGGFAGAGWHVHVMAAVGLAMILLFVALYARPFRRFQAAVAAGNWAEAQPHLEAIRRIVAVNLALGLVTSAVGASGRFWG
jgi:uncharacterized membrane protein